jgi:hypothetical protein
MECRSVAPWEYPASACSPATMKAPVTLAPVWSVYSHGAQAHQSETEGKGAPGAEREAKKSRSTACTTGSHRPYQMRYRLVGDADSTGPMWYLHVHQLVLVHQVVGAVHRHAPHDGSGRGGEEEEEGRVDPHFGKMSGVKSEGGVSELRVWTLDWIESSRLFSIRLALV